MSALFHQSDFSGGLDTQLDAAKTSQTSYPLCINGRSRRNTIAPTNKHEKLAGPYGTYQGLYIVGNYLILFVSGDAYYGNVTEDPIVFRLVGGWVTMSTTAPRIYAELVPATSNLFNRAGTPDTVSRTFNNSLAVFQQALFCFDGINSAQAILPSNAATSLGTYASWTKDSPLYVPVGVLPAFASNKLFVVAPDLVSILHSVSGRCSDFVVNIDAAGDKNGDATTVAQTVSYNPITAVRSISTGEVLVGTLYGTFVLELDYTNTIFGEPYLNSRFLFPAGPVNELSIVDILSDTAMITQSGIHAFNAVAQAKRESNNFPLGAKIRGLLTNPLTEKAIIQSDTCATLFDDYAFFAVNTVYGFGVIVLDTINKNYQALDLTFGQVKQFATTKISGVERLFYITANNEIFEAFSSEDKNTTRIYLGEWTPEEAPDTVVSYMVDAIFTNVRESGKVKFSIFGDRELREEIVVDVTAEDRNINLPIIIPFVEGKQVASAGFHFGKHARSWKIGVMVEWDFAGELSDFSIDGKIEKADNVRQEIQVFSSSENLVFISETGGEGEFNPGGVFPAAGFINQSVAKGAKYIYFANGNGPLLNGNKLITEGVFVAAGDYVQIQGTGDLVFSLRSINNFAFIMDAINLEENLTGILHGGNLAYPAGSHLDVRMGMYLLNRPFYPVCGAKDIASFNGKYFFSETGVPRYYTRTFEYVDVFFFDGEASEPDGISSTSIQAGVLRNWAAASVKPFKLVVVNSPPYTNAVGITPNAAIRYIATIPGISAILSGKARVMERIVVNAFPYFVCGMGGQGVDYFTAGSESAFQDNSHYGYLHIHADALTCKLTFKDTTGATLDSYALYA